MKRTAANKNSCLLTYTDTIKAPRDEWVLLWEQHYIRENWQETERSSYSMKKNFWVYCGPGQRPEKVETENFYVTQDVCRDPYDEFIFDRDTGTWSVETIPSRWVKRIYKNTKKIPMERFYRTWDIASEDQTWFEVKQKSDRITVFKFELKRKEKNKKTICSFSMPPNQEPLSYLRKKLNLNLYNVDIWWSGRCSTWEYLEKLNFIEFEHGQFIKYAA